MLAKGSELLTLGLQVQHSPLHHGGLHCLRFYSELLEYAVIFPNLLNPRYIMNSDGAAWWFLVSRKFLGHSPPLRSRIWIDLEWKVNYSTIWVFKVIFLCQKSASCYSNIIFFNEDLADFWHGKMTLKTQIVLYLTQHFLVNLLLDPIGMLNLFHVRLGRNFGTLFWDDITKVCYDI